MTEKETIYHKTTYNYNSLKKVLEDIGFKHITLWNWMEQIMEI